MIKGRYVLFKFEVEENFPNGPGPSVGFFNNCQEPKICSVFFVNGAFNKLCF